MYVLGKQEGSASSFILTAQCLHLVKKQTAIQNEGITNRKGLIGVRSSFCHMFDYIFKDRLNLLNHLVFNQVRKGRYKKLFTIYTLHEISFARYLFTMK